MTSKDLDNFVRANERELRNNDIRIFWEVPPYHTKPTIFLYYMDNGSCFRSWDINSLDDLKEIDAYIDAFLDGVKWGRR